MVFRFLIIATVFLIILYPVWLIVRKFARTWKIRLDDESDTVEELKERKTKLKQEINSNCKELKKRVKNYEKIKREIEKK